MDPRELKRHYVIRSFILLGFSLLLAELLVTGDIRLYLAPKFHTLSYFTLGILVVLTGVSIRQAIVGPVDTQACCEGEHKMPNGFFKSSMIYGLFVLPLLMGFIMPDKILGSDLAEKKGLNLLSGNSKIVAAANQAQQEQPKQAETTTTTGGSLSSSTDAQATTAEPVASTEEQIRLKLADQPFGDFYADIAVKMLMAPVIQLDDKIFLDGIMTMELFQQEFDGKKLETMGFVHTEESFAKNQFVTARFSVNCCTADAAVYGVLVEVPETMKVLPKDSWVKVMGELELRKTDQGELLVLKAEKVDAVKAPKDPYVYFNNATSDGQDQQKK